MAVRARGRSARRPVPPPPDAARRSCRHLPRGDRPSARRRRVAMGGESAHQRLFVAAAELLRLAVGHPRSAPRHRRHPRRRRRQSAPAPLPGPRRRSTSASSSPSAIARRHTHGARGNPPHLVSRHRAIDLAARPLDRPPHALIAPPRSRPRRHLVEQIDALAAASLSPFPSWPAAPRTSRDWVRLVEVNMIGGIPPATREVLQRVAIIGTAFDTDGFAAMSGSRTNRRLRPPRRGPRRHSSNAPPRLPVPPRPGPRRAAQ